MVQKKKRPATRKNAKKYRFQLSFTGIAGVGVVVFCLFFWMFLFGIWAGQTILLPSSVKKQVNLQADTPTVDPSGMQTLQAAGKKKAVP